MLTRETLTTAARNYSPTRLIRFATAAGVRPLNSAAMADARHPSPTSRRIVASSSSVHSRIRATMPVSARGPLTVGGGTNTTLRGGNGRNVSTGRNAVSTTSGGTSSTAANATRRSGLGVWYPRPYSPTVDVLVGTPTAVIASAHSR